MNGVSLATEIHISRSRASTFRRSGSPACRLSRSHCAARSKMSAWLGTALIRFVTSESAHDLPLLSVAWTTPEQKIPALRCPASIRILRGRHPVSRWPAVARKPQPHLLSLLLEADPTQPADQLDYLIGGPFLVGHRSPSP